MISLESQLQRNQRNKSLSQRLSEKKPSQSTISNPFKIASKLILEGNTLPTKIEKQQQEKTQQSSIQQMLSSNVTAKISKISDYVHLPKVKLNTNMDRETTPVSKYKSEEAIYMRNVLHQPNTGNNHSFLMQEQQNSIILQSHQKLSESQNRQDDNSLWNIQKLKMALDFVSLEQSDDQVVNIIRPIGKRRQGFKQHRQKQLEKERERVKRQRERNMEMVNGFLSGKATFMWLFILGKTVGQQNIKPVKDIYQTYFDNDYEIPLCHNYEQAKAFLKIQSCFFKIVSDLQNSQYLIDESQHNKNIIAIYIYNPQKQKGVSKSFELKRKSRKVRGMFMDLSDAAQMAEEQIQNQAKFIRVGNQLERQRNRLRFPAFFILNGIDNTDITSYRMCLFASLSLSEPKERLVYLQQFTSMVQLRYASNKTQLMNLEKYKDINHIDSPNQEKHKQIITFYAKESFYYALVNAVLRMSRNSQQFRPCVIPFNETYLAIKFYYQKYLTENGSKKIKFTTYRGAKLRNSDVKSLKLGSLIELLGFTSTSLNKQQALKFMDNDSYLIEIIVESTASDEKQADYDHGFVQLNRYGLAQQGFIDEQEVLFNALNVYQVIELDLDSAVRKITLKYGSIIDLLRAKNALKGIQRSVLQNYRHCINTFKSIQDDGDALLLAHQHDQCVSYYTTKIESGVSNSKHLGKLAGAQLEIGDIDSAYKNALLSLQMIENQKRENGLAASYKVPISYNSAVFQQTYDIVNYEKSTNIYLVLENKWDKKCSVLMKRAKNKLNNGDYSGCLKDITLSDNILKSQEQSFHRMRKDLKRKYFFSFLCCFCSKLLSQIEQKKQLQLLKIQQQQIIFFSKKELYRELKLQSKIMLSSCKSKIGNSPEYHQALSQAKQIFESLSYQKYDESMPIQHARYKFLQAQTMDLSNQYSQFQDLVEQAIDSLKAENPFHPSIAEYCEVLGNQHYQKIQLSLNVPKSEGEKPMRKRTDRFDYQEHKIMYKKCRLYLQQAADQLSYLKGSNSTKVLAINNQLATLDYDFSLLKQAEDRTKKSVALIGPTNNPQGAKCYILLAKIALAKGELKRASVHIQQATSILHKALIKFETPQYNKVLIRHPLNIQICSLRGKVFNRQQKHDLALKQLQLLQRLVKLQKPFSLSLLANLEEEEAEVLVCLGETQNFESCILRSVEIREQAMGKYNIPNAISFSNLFKYLRYTNDFENAIKYHQKSTEIFSRFPPDHPNTWVLHLSNGLIFYQRRQFSLALPELEAGLRIAERRYSSNHINFMKIRLQFAKIMKGMGQFDRSLRLLQSLEAVVTRNLKESALNQKIQNEIDDQKIALRRNLLLQMKEIHERERKGGDSLRTALGLQRIQISLRECEQFISSGQKMDSLKSLT